MDKPALPKRRRGRPTKAEALAKKNSLREELGLPPEEALNPHALHPKDIDPLAHIDPNDFQDPCPDELMNPSNPPIGIAANNREAEDVDKVEKQFTDWFFPPLPKPLSNQAMSHLPPSRRKSRFLQAWDASCGNLSVALRLSGYTRDEYDDLCNTDAKFAAELKETNFKIADRTKYVLMERVGVVKSRRVVGKISEYLLGQTVKALNQDLYGDKGEGSVTIAINVPRPARGTNGNAPVQPPPKAD